jgi:hypothetical protein
VDEQRGKHERLTLLNNIRDSMEEAFGHVGGIEYNCRGEVLEAHIRALYVR